MASPTVSVVIPTRRRPELLGRTLASALAQRHVEIEVVVVHDGPDEDGSALAPARHAGARVVIEELGRPAGMAAARNAGARRAQGTWLAFLDDDDLWAPSKLRGQLDAAGSHAALAYSSAVTVDEHLRVIAGFTAPDPEGLAGRLLTGNVIPAGASNVLVQRERFLELGGFDESFVHLADWDAWIRLAAELRAARDPGITVGYVQHSAMMSLRQADGLLEEGRRLAARHATSLGTGLARADFDRWAAGRLRGAGRSREAARLYLTAAVRARSPTDLARAVHAGLRLPPPPRRRPAAPWLAEAAALAGG